MLREILLNLDADALREVLRDSRHSIEPAGPIIDDLGYAIACAIEGYYVQKYREGSYEPVGYHGFLCWIPHIIKSEDIRTMTIEDARRNFVRVVRVLNECGYPVKYDTVIGQVCVALEDRGCNCLDIAESTDVLREILAESETAAD